VSPPPPANLFPSPVNFPQPCCWFDRRNTLWNGVVYKLPPPNFPVPSPCQDFNGRPPLPVPIPSTAPQRMRCLELPRPVVFPLALFSGGSVLVVFLHLGGLTWTLVFSAFIDVSINRICQTNYEEPDMSLPRGTFPHPRSVARTG